MSRSKLSRRDHNDLGGLVQRMMRDWAEISARIRQIDKPFLLSMHEVQEGLDRSFNGIAMLKLELAQQATRDHGDAAWSGKAYGYDTEIHPVEELEL